MVRLLIIFALVCVATTSVWFRMHKPTVGIDDANIFFVYAENLSAGRGFVFNQGGERVEGFTSLAWLLICTAASRTAVPEHLLLLTTVLLVTLTISCCVKSSILRCSSNEEAVSLPWMLVFLALLLSDDGYVAWSTITLMETALWSALLTTSAIVVMDDAVDRMHVHGLAALMALMVVTRPEALVWAPCAIVLFYLNRKSVRGHESAFRSAIPAALAFALTAGLLTVFRLWYFGYPLPNTYYAKVSPSLTYRLREGANYLWAYLSSGPLTVACFLGVIFSIFHLLLVKPRDARVRTLCAMAAVGLMIPVFMGGDHFGGSRFYQPVYPILLLTLVNAARFLLPQYIAPRTGRDARRGLLVAASMVAGLFLAERITDWGDLDDRLSLGWEFAIAEFGRDRGRHAEILFAELESRPSIGTITVGGLKYAYSGDVIDLMGLNNTRMAHNNGNRVGIRSHAAFEKLTFYELRPMLVIPLVQYSELALQRKRSPFVDVALKGLIDDKLFRDSYRLAEVRRATPGGVVSVAGWYDRTFLSQLGRLKEFQVMEPQTLSQ